MKGTIQMGRYSYGLDGSGIESCWTTKSERTCGGIGKQKKKKKKPYMAVYIHALIFSEYYK